MKMIYICNDTMTGLCSALHDAWLENRNGEAGIQLKGRTQQQLFCQYKTVDENEGKARRLEHMLKHHLGGSACRDIYYALLADDDEKGTAVFRTVQEARNVRDSRRIMEHLGHPDVAKVFELSQKVSNEAHLYEEFIRFRELQSGILFSEITPKAQVLACIGDHFADRFPLENWAVYDKTHRVFLMHRKKEPWALVWGETLDQGAAGRVSEGEICYQELWKGFFDSISIRERENYRCQRNHLPLRYRPDMTEFGERRPSKQDQ